MATSAETPNLDALARKSTRFTHAFTTAGVCAPSRAARITGQHQLLEKPICAHPQRHLGYLAQPPAISAPPEPLRTGYHTGTDGKLDHQLRYRAGSGPFTLGDKDGRAPKAGVKDQRVLYFCVD